jgi:hypothetical protein
VAGGDYRLKVGFVDHPKVERLVRLLGDGVLRNLLRVFEYAALNRPDGNLASLTSEDIEMVARWSRRRPGKFVEALLKVGFLDENGSGSFRLHDWCEHQPFLASFAERSERAKKAARMRWDSEVDDANSMRDASAEHAPEMPGVCATDAERNAPSPIPIPTPTHKNGASAPEVGSTLRSGKRKPRKIEYSPEFEKAFGIYPPTSEGHSKAAAYRAWRARIAAGVSPDELIGGVERYAAFIQASGRTVKMASTFFGPDEHWKLPWAFADSRTNGKKPEQPLPTGEEYFAAQEK